VPRPAQDVKNEARFAERALAFLAKEINIGKKDKKNAEK
jgi:hypothetical protein